MTKPVGFLTNSLTGLEGEAGIYYNYILATDGLYIRAKNDKLAATVCIASQEVRGLVPLAEDIRLLSRQDTSALVGTGIVHPLRPSGY